MLHESELIPHLEVSLAKLPALVLAQSIDVAIGLKGQDEVTAARERYYASRDLVLAEGRLLLPQDVAGRRMGCRGDLVYRLCLEVDLIEIALICQDDSILASAIVGYRPVELEDFRVGPSDRVPVAPAEQVGRLINETQGLAASADYVDIRKARVLFNLYLFACLRLFLRLLSHLAHWLFRFLLDLNFSAKEDGDKRFLELL